MKRLTSLLFTLYVCMNLFAQNYIDYFDDATLRMDITMAGKSDEMRIYLNEYARLNGWAGRRNHLSEQENRGNGLAVMRDAVTNEVIYTTTFCALFNEWQATDEAKLVAKAFQQVLLFPYPKKKAVISIDFRGYEGVYHNYLNVPVDPEDILIRPKSNAGYKTKTILHSGSSSECVDIAIVGEGYAAKDQKKFFKDAERVTNYLFAHQPFDQLKTRFNVVAVGAVSLESGATHPQNKIWRNTIMGSHYDTFYSNRYLMSDRLYTMHDCLVDVPYEQIIVLVNTETYGGGGIYNSHTLISADDKQTDIIIVHEFGHSFAGLADEYYYPGDVMENFYNRAIEPWEDNITTLVDFESKWKNMLPEGTPIPTPEDKSKPEQLGVYEGGGYATKGIYRPTQDCRMKSNTPDHFCPVCTRALERVVDFLTK